MYLWGDNNTSRLGGVAARYTLPRIPPTLAAGTISNFDIGGHFLLHLEKDPVFSVLSVIRSMVH